MKRYSQIAIFLTLLTALMLIVSSVGAAPKDGPVIRLSAGLSEFSAAQDVLLTVSISNPTRHSVRILKWFTPAEGLEEPIFVVKTGGEPVPYLGATYKRPAPTGSDYLTLKSGETLSYTVNLGDYYDLSTTGEYEIYYKASSFILFSERGNGYKTVDTLISESIRVKIESHPPKGKKPTPQPTPPPGGNTFNGCTTTQQNTLINARAAASNYATDSKNYLYANNTGPRYTTWFGTVTTSRYNTVTSHFTSISTAWDTAGVNFDCTCRQNYYAYVYPNKPYYIYLCKVFWTAPLTGTDSKAGTLIHEMSHFTVVASTDDYVYGQTGAMDLAITSPDKAVDNADNHEYFAENNPHLQ